MFALSGVQQWLRGGKLLLRVREEQLVSPNVTRATKPSHLYDLQPTQARAPWIFGRYGAEICTIWGQCRLTDPLSLCELAF
jgi:hypothetical protein